MTYIPYQKPDEEGMVRCFSATEYCPFCWDDLWWIAGTRKTVCRNCKRYTEEHIGKVDLRYDPLQEDELPDWLADPRFKWEKDGRAWVGARFDRDGNRHVDIKTGKPSDLVRVVIISREEIEEMLDGVQG